MRRTERLFQIIQILRSRNRPVTGQELAEELEVSLRTLYRDMAELTAGRVPVRGEAGTGYVLEAGYDMPPLMLTADELEAAVLGAAWVAKRGDATLARGARDLIAKLTESIPKDMQPVLMDAGLKHVGAATPPDEGFDVGLLRMAVRNRNKVDISYRDGKGDETTRTIWPFLIGYMDEIRLIAAWCESREGFRNFRTDRITKFDLRDDIYPDRKADLRKRWSDAKGIRL
jgi:predicted DNA-binding transcriptional regulator YafY